MKYAILIYDENTASSDPNPDPASFGNVMEEYNAFTKADVEHRPVGAAQS